MLDEILLIKDPTMKEKIVVSVVKQIIETKKFWMRIKVSTKNT
jgi:hypothetical protein